MPSLLHTRKANLLLTALLTIWTLAYWARLFDLTWAFLTFGITMAFAAMIDYANRQADMRGEDVPIIMRIGANALLLACIGLLAIALLRGTIR